MPDLSGWLILVAAALAGSVVGGVAGFGAGVILLPVVASVVGVRAAVPVLTVTMLIGNLSRIWWSRRDIVWPVAGRYALGAIPGTALGVLVFAGIPGTSLGRLLGAFLIASVPLRRLLHGRALAIRLGHFTPLGAGFGLLSALVVTTGPLVTPFFLAHGLRRGAYIATEALCALTMHVARGAGLASLSLVTREAAGLGLTLGATMFVGSWLGRRLVDRLSDRAFLVAVEVMLVLMGLHFLALSR